MYHWAGLIALMVTAMAALLAILGLAFARPDASGASVLCAIAFFIPGLAFINYARQLRFREQLIGRVAALAQDRGVVGLDAFSREMGVKREDAEWLLRQAVAEGRINGSFEPDGFVASTALRCPSCKRPSPRSMVGGRCPHCAAPLPSGAP